VDRRAFKFDRRKIAMSASLIITLTLIMLFLVFSPPSTPYGPLEVEKRAKSQDYIFLEYWVNEDGKVIEGEPLALCIDFPTYWLSEDSRELRGIVEPESLQVNSSLKLICGFGESYSGDRGCGATSSLLGVYGLPFIDEFIDLEIGGLSGDGTVAVKVEGTDVSLKPGEEWESSSKTIFRWGGGVIEVERCVTLTNHGFVKFLRED